MQSWAGRLGGRLEGERMELLFSRANLILFPSMPAPVLRKRLARILNACILSKRCPPDCLHQHRLVRAQPGPLDIPTTSLTEGISITNLALPPGCLVSFDAWARPLIRPYITGIHFSNIYPVAAACGDKAPF